MTGLGRDTVLVDAAGGREFRLLRCLGEGGFGSVYLALVRSAGGLEQRVAVKLLRPDTDARNQAVERLRDEARVLASLHHPVILVAHDLVQLGEKIALVTEYVEGQDLGEVMADPVDPIPVSALVDVVGQVAGALDAAWSTTGIVHRDVKPANIRIGRHGNVKLLDFGIAKSGVGPARTQTNVVLGSLLYMAPERFERGKALSPAFDVFGLGCVLFEGMTRRPLFDRGDAVKMFGLAMLASEFDAEVGRRLAVVEPPVVRELLGRMLLRDPQRRISSADLPVACDTVQTTLPGRETLRTWCRKRQWPDVPIEERTGGVPQPSDPLALPPEPPGRGGTTMEVANWAQGLALAPRASVEAEEALTVLDRTMIATPATPVPAAPASPPATPAPAIPAPAPPRARPVVVPWQPPPAPAAPAAPRLVLGPTMPPPTGGAESIAWEQPPNRGRSVTRWGIVGAAGSVVLIGMLAMLLVGIGISALGLVLTAGQDTPRPEPALAPIVEGPAPRVQPVPRAQPVPPPRPEPPRPSPAPRPDAIDAPVRVPPAPVPTAPVTTVPGAAPASAVPEPVAATGSVTMDRDRPFELRSGGTVVQPGPSVPAGAYEMFVDFGKGWVAAGPITVTGGSRTVVVCNSITWACAPR